MKYGGYSLRVLGTDSGLRTKGLPGANLDSNSNDRSSQYLNQASQSLGGAASGLSAGTQLAQQISSDLTNNAIQSNNTQTEIARTQAQVAGVQAENSARIYGTISKSLTDYADSQAKQKAARDELAYKKYSDALRDAEEAKRFAITYRQEQRAEQAFQQGVEDDNDKRYREDRDRQTKKYEAEVAIQDYATLEQDATDIQYNLGTTSLQTRLETLNQKHRGKVSPEFTSEWTKRINERQSGEATRMSETRYKNIAQVQDFQREQHKQLFNIESMGVVKQIANGVLPVADGIQRLDEMSSSYSEANRLSPLDSLAVRSEALKAALDSGSLSFDAQTIVQKKLIGLGQATVAVNQLNDEERVTQLDPNEKNRRLYQISVETGVDMGELSKWSDPLAAITQQRDNAALADTISDLDRKSLISGINSTKFNEANVGDAVATLISQGASAADAVLSENNPNTKGIVFYDNVRQVYKEHKDYILLRGDTDKGVNELQITRNKLRLDYEKLKSAGASEDNILKALQSQMARSVVNNNLPESMRPALQEAQSRTLDVGKVGDIYENIDTIYNAQIQQLQGKLAAARQSLARYGLDDLNPGQNRVSSITKFRVRNRAVIDGYNKTLENLPAAQKMRGASSNFNRGTGARLNPVPSRDGTTQTVNGVDHSPIVSPTQLKTITASGQQILVPFAANQAVQISSDYGGTPDSAEWKRRGRAHAGIDFAVPNGTSIVSPVAGKVIKVAHQVNAGTGRGYGHYIDVQIPDGRVLRYAHAANFSVRQGDAVSAGQVLGRSGDSGAPGQAHLHFEVRGSSSYGYEDSYDPKAFLAGLKGGHISKSPRRNNEMNDYYNPYNNDPPSDRPRTPSNSLKLPLGAYLFGGAVYGRSGVSKPAAQTYNRANPIKNMDVPSSTHGIDIAKMNQPGSTYGYAVLAKNPGLANSIAKTATWLGIPAVWLADVMHFESGFQVNKQNQFGFVGLMQMGKAFLSEIGMTTQQLVRMNYESQMDVWKKYVNRWGLRGKITTMAELYLLQQRPAHVMAYKNGDKAKLDQADGNGSTVRHYIQNNIGKEAGRRYKVSSSDRRSNAISTVHDNYNQGCTLCNQLSASNSPIVPHSYQA